MQETIFYVAAGETLGSVRDFLFIKFIPDISKNFIYGFSNHFLIIQVECYWEKPSNIGEKQKNKENPERNTW